MQSIVGALRWMILIVLGVIIFAVVLFAMEYFVGSGTLPPAISGLGLIGALLILIFFILSVGMVATVISIHDRHAEIAEELRLMRELYEARG